MTVQINNGYIQNSPFHLNLGPGPISPPNCKYIATTNEIYAGDVTPFQVASYDAFGNPIITCNQTIPVTFNASLQLKGAVVAPVLYVSCSKGVYTLNYTETIANDGYSLSVMINNIPIAKSPFNIEVTAAREISATMTTAAGVGLYNATAGVPAPVTIMAEDRYGNPNTRCDAAWADFDLELFSTTNNSLTCSGQVIGCDAASGYTAQWTCYIATVYTLSIQYQTTPINNGTVYIPTVVPGPLTGPKTNAYGVGLHDAYAGENSYVYLDPHDQYDNQITTCDKAHFDPELLTVIVNDQNGNNIGGTVDNCTASSTGAVIILHYNITSIDLTILSIAYANNSIIDSPWILNTHAGPPAPGNCNATGLGLSMANAGEYGVFQVTCADRFDNIISECLPLSNWFYSLVGAHNISGIPYQCLNSTGIAQTDFHYNQTVSGEYGLTFGYNNLTLNPYDVTVYPGPFDPANSVAVGDGVYSQTIRAGDRTNFEILARDRWGNEVTNCLNDSLIKITSNPPLRPSSNQFIILPCNATSNRTLVQYASTLASTYIITITYGGAMIQNDPYKPKIIAGPLDYETIVANGTGLTYAQAGIPATLTLQGNDQYGNPVNYCNSSEYNNFDLTLDLENSTQKVHLDGVVWTCGVMNGAGTYQANYTAYVSGTYDFHIQYEDDDINNSPFSPIVVPGPNNYSQAYVYADQDQTVAGEFGYLEVVPRDSYQNNLTSCLPYLMFTANFSGVRAGDNKTFNYQYSSAVCNQTGPYALWTIPFTLNGATTYDVVVFGSKSGQEVSNSPLSALVVPNVIYPGESYLNNFDPTAIYVVGQTVDYTLTVADQYENNITNCPDTNYTHFTVYTKAAKTYPGKVTCENGVYQGTFTALQVGIYKLYIQYNTLNLVGSPYSPLNFTYGYPSGLSYAVGPGVESDSIVAGTTTSFTIYTTNQYNFSIESCPPAPFSASNWSVSFDESYRFDQEVTSLQVGDCVDGTFPASYTPTKARTYSITIQLDDKDIRNDPYTPTVIPGPLDVSKTIITGLNGTGDNGTIILQTRDAYGNAETNINLTQFKIGLSPRCAQSDITTTSSGGTLYAHYTVYEGGVYCPSIEYVNYGVDYVFPLNGTIHATGGIACNNSCNYQGYCFKNQNPSTVSTNFSCSCFQGYTGVECGDKMSSKYPLAIGAVVGLIVGLSILLFIIGLILGFVVFKFMNRRGGYNQI